MAIGTTLAVPDPGTVDPGPLRLTARYATADGAPISGAVVTATGSCCSLPLAMAEEAAGTYQATIDIPPDVDGARSLVRVTARTPRHASAHAAASFFSADPAWVAMPDHVERELHRLAAAAPNLVELEQVAGYAGELTWAVTVTDRGAPEAGHVNVLFTQSHGNEPGATAALMDVVTQLATGVTQEGEPTPLERERLLRARRVVCIPVGNPSGRARAPVQYWCDQIHTDDRYLYAYGALAGGERLPMTSLFRRSEHTFDPRFPMPLRFEQVDEDTFIEPFFASVPLGSVGTEDYGELCHRVESEPMYRTTQWRLVKRFLDRYPFAAALDMHQGAVQEQIDEATGQRVFDHAAQNWMRGRGLAGYDAGGLELAHQLADRIEAGWRDLGIQVVPRHLLEKGYFSAVNITDFMHHYGRGHPASFFIEQNQGLGTDKAMQKRIHVRSIQSVLAFLAERA